MNVSRNASGYFTQCGENVCICLRHILYNTIPLNSPLIVNWQIQSHCLISSLVSRPPLNELREDTLEVLLANDRSALVQALQIV